ncbi:MAG: hypothetical protein WHT46_10495 [Candidatus Geothermincolales bacterium]
MTPEEQGQYDLEIFNPGYANQELAEDLGNSGDLRCWREGVRYRISGNQPIYGIILDIRDLNPDATDS